MDASDIARAFEPLRLRAGGDEAGNLVIGYGHRARGLVPAARIDEVTAEILLMQDISRAEKNVRGLVRINLNENQRQAVLSWAMGYAPVRIRGSRALTLLNRGRLLEFSDALRRWDWIPDPQGNKVPCERIKERREEERSLFLRPIVIANNKRVCP